MRLFRTALSAATTVALLTSVALAQTVPSTPSASQGPSATGRDTPVRAKKPAPRKSTPLVQAQAAQPAPAPVEPPPPIPSGPGRADPGQVPDPHPTGKTSDEGSTEGSAPGMRAEDASGEPAAPPAKGATRKSRETNDKSTPRAPVRRDRPSQ